MCWNVTVEILLLVLRYLSIAYSKIFYWNNLSIVSKLIESYSCIMFSKHKLIQDH